jgi:hypothetical protein
MNGGRCQEGAGGAGSQGDRHDKSRTFAFSDGLSSGSSKNERGPGTSGPGGGRRKVSSSIDCR